MSAHALLSLIQQAPNGYPCKHAIKNVLMMLHNETKMLKLTHAEVNKNCTLMEKCEKAAEVWKVMAKHCIDLKLQGKPVGGKLQCVVDIIDAKPVQLPTDWVSPEKSPD